MAEKKQVSTAAQAGGERTELEDACNIPEMATLFGKSVPIWALDYNDLAELDNVTGGMEFLDLRKFAHMRCILWLTLRKSDPNITEAERDRGHYKLTEWEVGKRFHLRNINREEVQTFLEQVLDLTGLSGDGTDPKNQAEDPEATPTDPTPGASAT